MEKRPENKIYKIAVTGPESTGKSVVSAELASHYNTLWVPEYAREYLVRLNRDYISGDLVEIARGQYEREIATYSHANKLIISDTDFLVLKIWHEYKFDFCPEYIENKVKHHRYDLYLLMDIDIEWEYDPMREHPHMREYFFNLYRNQLENYKLPYKIVSGKGKSRLNNAIAFIEKLMVEK